VYINRMACFSLFISFFSRTRCLRLSLSLYYNYYNECFFFGFVFIFLVADDDDLVFIIVSPHPKLFP
jgi:hypothetical protein